MKLSTQINSETMNECVYIHSLMKANYARCEKRLRYWTTIHKHVAKTLDRPNLVKPRFLREQAI